MKGRSFFGLVIRSVEAVCSLSGQPVETYTNQSINQSKRAKVLLFKGLCIAQAQTAEEEEKDGLRYYYYYKDIIAKCLILSNIIVK